MAKRKSKRSRLAKRQQQQRAKPSRRLQDAANALTNGRIADALTLSTAALKAANDPQTRAKAQKLVCEANFRAAATSNNLSLRLQHLDTIMEIDAQDPRVLYHRGVTLFQLGKHQEAAAAFDAVVAQNAKRSGVRFLQQLAKVAAKQPWSQDGLSETEIDTLTIADSLMRKKATANEVKLAKEKKLVGDSQTWDLLLQMATKNTSAPYSSLEKLVRSAESTKNSTTSKHAPLSAVLPYYLGVAALRKRDEEAARQAWQQAGTLGFGKPWFRDNRSGLMRYRLVELAKEERWQDVLDLASQTPALEDEDAIFGETVAMARFHMGYQAAQNKRWAEAVTYWESASKHIRSRYLAQNLALAQEATEDWLAAADSWREMVRRRPRKATHPDYLTDTQIAAIWGHTAGCYVHARWTHEAITCMKNAVKYAPDNKEMRLLLVDLYMQDERVEAAENEVERILDLDAGFVPALMRQGALYSDRWDRSAMPVWKQILTIEPNHEEAREALAHLYLEQIDGDSQYSWMRQSNPKQEIKTLEQALKEVPGHPKLLIALAIRNGQSRKYKKARELLRQAYDASPTNPEIIGEVMHELLHFRGEKIVHELLPNVRQVGTLLSAFWVDQGRRVVECELGDDWARAFWKEAITLSEEGRKNDTKAFVLTQIFDAAMHEDDWALADEYATLARKEVPKSGAVEYMDAYLASEEGHDQKKALQLLRKARQMAKKAGETAIMEMAEHMENILSGHMPSFDEFMRILGGPGGPGGGSQGGGSRSGRNPILDILGGLDIDDLDIDEEVLDELERLF